MWPPHSTMPPSRGGRILRWPRPIARRPIVSNAATTIQVHGGIGFTWEHPAHLYLRRARTDAQLLGDPACHRERYIRLREAQGMTDDGVRDEVREWLAANWTPGMDRGRWATWCSTPGGGCRAGSPSGGAAA